MTRKGIVYLVGAGPGDRDLITLRGVECLRRADLVLYDYLVNSELLEHVSSGAECICLGRHGEPRWTQQAIGERMVAAARDGLTVVRLKSGDPMIFGRAAEELLVLGEAGVGFEIVPGITAALAAAASLGMPITSRDAASAVALVTGQESGEKSEEDQLDYQALAGFPGTLVFYMGVTTAAQWTTKLMAAGVPADRPVALVRRCSWPDQRVVFCRLDEVVGQVVPRSLLPPPVIAIVGEAAAACAAWNHEDARPLFGETVVVTRPRHQAKELGEAFRELGASVVYQPALEIKPLEDWSEVDRQLDDLRSFHWIVFSSSNGVDFFFRRLRERGGDLRRLADVQVAAVGPGTADALARFQVAGIEQPAAGFRAESLVELLQDRVAGRRVLVVRAERGRDVLVDGLRTRGADVKELVVYRSEEVSTLEPEVARVLRPLSTAWVLATSSASARSLVRLLGDLSPSDATGTTRWRWVSISPLTSQTLRECGVEAIEEAAEATSQSLVETVLQRSRQDRTG